MAFLMFVFWSVVQMLQQKLLFPEECYYKIKKLCNLPSQNLEGVFPIFLEGENCSIIIFDLPSLTVIFHWMVFDPPKDETL